MDLKSFYSARVEHHSKTVSILKSKLRRLSFIRLLVFLTAGFSVYKLFSIPNYSNYAIAVAVLGIVVFLALLLHYLKHKKALALEKALLQINTDELRVLEGDFHFKNEGLEFQNGNHNYSLDIDLFGRGSFFQNIDRTQTNAGALELANLLKANHIEDITKRQEAIKELSQKTDWRQHYQATESLIEVEHKTEDVVKWLNNYQSKLPKFSLVLGYGFCAVTLIVIGLSIAKQLPMAYIGYLLLVGLGISGAFVKHISYLATYTSKIKDTFKQFATLLETIENEEFTSNLLQEQQALITNDAEKASVIFKQFSKYLDALDNRNNLIGAIFGNGYFLTDLRHAYRIEQWINKNKGTVEQWFKTITFFEAYNSFGTYAFNHQGFVFPNIVNDKSCVKATNLGHPLLDEAKRVSSDLEIDNQQFFIITGANMAGKSTFLRTVSLHIVMANVGLPVCATTSDYYPIKLITSMRTTDNLTDDSSYFFSELTRLKYIVDAIKSDTYFIILDEILKGTNSKDKAEGSHKFIQKLVATNATGIIATHDLSLCTIEDELKAVKNYYFDAEIVNDELYFDYKFKKGICQNMNASFLLKKMEIV